MMFSATISSDIDYLAKKYTRKAVEVAVESFVDPTKLTQFYYDVPDHQKFSLMVALLKQENADLVMVFCNTRRNVDFVAGNLILNGIHAKAIHGGIEQKKRIKVLEEFHQKGLGVLVCTDVAARGLDIKGVSHVYNYDVPAEAKDYIHRIGRTARAGKDGKAITVLASRDYENFSNLINRNEVKIEKKELPELSYVKMNVNSGKKRFNRERSDMGGGRGRGSSRGRDSSRGSSRGRDSSRGSSRGRDSSRGSSRGPSRGSSGGRSSGRSSSARSSGARSSGRSSGSRSFSARSSDSRRSESRRSDSRRRY
ncbi:hypothetical protein CO037_01780 [Candidatus Pacearchaeota archaeon CG_4_9_14_0_2_um_filter_30_8]|nr:MAG: hypothetical protein CO037_01780 [Candidatus Pacearchaeota archaeon CG_4_9_14_0_2_um_filter_30_8]